MARYRLFLIHVAHGQADPDQLGELFQGIAATEVDATADGDMHDRLFVSDRLTHAAACYRKPLQSTLA